MRSLAVLLIIVPMLSACVPALVAGTATTVSMVHDRRTAGSIVDDRGIELKTFQALYQEDFYAKSRIKTVSYNNNVLLVGQVPNDRSKRIAEQVVQDVEKVRTVYNELAVGERSGLSTRSSDTWITTKVKTALVKDTGIDPTRVKVVTENATVYLLGLVTPDEALKATEVVRKVKGVQQVTRVFEYIEPELVT